MSTTKNTRVGYYCWAGPGTIDMLRVKYFSPELDQASIMNSYEYTYLKKIKDLFGITDFWATYSWGFSNNHELQHKKFLLDKLHHFKSLDIDVHAYVQGTNLVYKDFAQEHFWARDNYNRLIPYFRGRKVCCVNNPHFQRFFKKKLEEAISKPFAGIFIDNVQMGQMTIPVHNKPLTFYGCACRYCQKKYTRLTGGDLLKDWRDRGEKGQRYKKFRVNSTHAFLTMCSKLVKASGKCFGTNSYDPKFDSRLTYGFDPIFLSTIQDYLLFETHSFPKYGISKNAHIDSIAQSISVPVFNLSYYQGIGREEAFTQEDIDALFSETQQYTYNLLLKGSEFTTQNVWHNLRVDAYKKPKHIKIKKENLENNHQENILQKTFRAIIFTQPFNKIIDYTYGLFLYLLMEVSIFRILMRFVYRFVIR